MVDVVLKLKWSKSKEFLLPLTGLKKHTDVQINTYLFWKDYSIENYQLTVLADRSAKGFANFHNDLMQHPPAEIFEHGKYAILIFDLSGWAEDVEKFLKGKYSKLSVKAKDRIKEYHTMMDGKSRKMNVTLYCALYPKDKKEEIDNMSPLEYVLKHDIITTRDDEKEAIITIGEVCGIYDTDDETLTI